MKRKAKAADPAVARELRGIRRELRRQRRAERLSKRELGGEYGRQAEQGNQEG